MKSTRSLIACATLLLAVSTAAQAQSSLPPAPQNVVQLEASGTVEVQQDVLVLTLGTVKEGKDAALVQTQLRQALDAALQEARRSAEPQKMEVRTGNFSLSPRYAQNQQITGWQGTVTAIFGGAVVGCVWFIVAMIWQKTAGENAPELLKAETAEGEKTEVALGAQVPYGPMLAIAGAAHFLWLHKPVAVYFAQIQELLVR